MDRLKLLVGVRLLSSWRRVVVAVVMYLPCKLKFTSTQEVVMHDALTIGELSARSGVAPSALRYYERLGLIWATRTGGNQRRYERAMLRRVAFIRVSAQVGVPLEESHAARAMVARILANTKKNTNGICTRRDARLNADMVIYNLHYRCRNGLQAQYIRGVVGLSIQVLY